MLWWKKENEHLVQVVPQKRCVDLKGAKVMKYCAGILYLRNLF
jgi:hypothetical protein